MTELTHFLCELLLDVEEERERKKERKKEHLMSDDLKLDYKKKEVPIPLYHTEQSRFT